MPFWILREFLSLKEETFSLAWNSNFLWFCKEKLSILNHKVLLVTGLWVTDRFARALLSPLIFNPIQLCQTPESEWASLTNYTPQPRLLMAVHSHDTCHKAPPDQVCVLLEMKEGRNNEAQGNEIWLSRLACSLWDLITYCYSTVVKWSFPLLKSWVRAHLVNCKPGLTATDYSCWTEPCTQWRGNEEGMRS